MTTLTSAQIAERLRHERDCGKFIPRSGVNPDGSSVYGDCTCVRGDVLDHIRAQDDKLRRVDEAMDRADKKGFWICNKCGWISEYGEAKHAGCTYLAVWSAMVPLRDLTSILKETPDE